MQPTNHSSIPVFESFDLCLWERHKLKRFSKCRIDMWQQSSASHTDYNSDTVRHPFKPWRNLQGIQAKYILSRICSNKCMFALWVSHLKHNLFHDILNGCIMTRFSARNHWQTTVTASILLLWNRDIICFWANAAETLGLTYSADCVSWHFLFFP